jgi:hypothetical protein
MTVDELVAALEREAQRLEPSAAVRADFEQLAREHRFRADAATLQQYLRVKLVFEAVREAGWWRLAWDVTDREPRSDAIWRAWRNADATALVSATAECDETSALAAFLLRRLGVSKVGLLWPMSNHTVAVWKVARTDGSEARVVLPTSQIFLDPSDGLGTRAFDTSVQRTVYDYTRSDARGGDTISPALGALFLERVRNYAGASDATQRKLRVLRARVMAREPLAAIEAERAAIARELEANDAPAPDTRAVDAFANELQAAAR